MNNQRILYTQDGQLVVLIPAPDCGLTLEEIAAKDVPAGLEWVIVDKETIPEDRTFRGAWTHQDGRITEDLAIAKTLANDLRRKAREREFAPLDVKATIPAEFASVESQRQAIRIKYAEMQTAIDDAVSPDELRAIL